MSYQPAPEDNERAWGTVPDGEPHGGDMPVYGTPLIGRDDDVARLCSLLRDQGHRMVVVTGSGGIGKTRLAVEVAGELERAWRHGTRFLSFAAVSHGNDLDAALAWHLGLRDIGGQSYRESIRQHLQFREELLVIDNIEHLPELADLLVDMQRACPSVSMLVTSRSELGIYGEVIHQLDPLPVLDRSAILPGVQTAIVRESPAVRLIVERARAVDDRFDLTDGTAPIVAEICETLGGIPLALELIAPRLASADPQRLHAELVEMLDRPDVQGHQALEPAVTVQQTMRLSYDRLDERQQWVFRVLSIMHGLWSVDDVLPLLTPELDELDAIELIEALVTRSLVASPTGAVGEMRFAMNPVLRHFGRSMLVASGERPAIADRHASRMIALAEEAEPEFTGRNQQEWLARIDVLYDDFRHAHGHLRETGRCVDALRLATGLWRYAYTRGHYRQLREWVESSVGEIDDHDELRARALNGVGFLANMTGDFDGARLAHQRALGLAEPLALHREIGIGRVGLADIAVTADDDTETALRHLERAAVAYERLDDPRGRAAVLTNRGNIQWYLRELDAAYTTHERARMFYEAASDLRGMAWSDTNTGRIAQQQGRHHDAVPRLLAALDNYRALGDARGIAETLEALAGITVSQGDAERALKLAGAAVRLREAYGVPLKNPDLAEFEEALGAARAAAGSDAALHRGQQLSPEEAIALARSVEVPPPDGEAGAPPDYPKLAHEAFGITSRELQVLSLAGEGLTDPQIAERLGISSRTVQTYMSSMLRKMEVISRVSAVRAAHQAGILPGGRR